MLLEIVEWVFFVEVVFLYFDDLVLFLGLFVFDSKFYIWKKKKSVKSYLCDGDNFLVILFLWFIGWLKCFGILGLL